MLQHIHNSETQQTQVTFFESNRVYFPRLSVLLRIVVMDISPHLNRVTYSASIISHALYDLFKCAHLFNTYSHFVADLSQEHTVKFHSIIPFRSKSPTHIYTVVWLGRGVFCLWHIEPCLVSMIVTSRVFFSNRSPAYIIIIPNHLDTIPREFVVTLSEGLDHVTMHLSALKSSIQLEIFTNPIFKKVLFCHQSQSIT